MSHDAALSLRGVRKRFGSTVAVGGVDLVVPRGALYGLIGPNGAGKTTCIRMIMGILFPDAGELSVLGLGSALDAKDRIGYLPEERGVYRKMRVGAFIAYMAKLKGLDGTEASRRISELLDRVGLPGVELKRCEDLSKGMLQRVQFVSTVVHRPDLLILDEPFSGLDPVSVKVLRDYVLEEHRRGATVLFSTHVMAHAEELCDHVVMLYRGQKVLDEPVQRLRRQFDPQVILFEPFDPEAPVEPIRTLPGIEGVERMKAGASLYRVRVADGVDAHSCIPRIAAAVPAARIELARLTLEDVFIRIVSGSSPVEAAEARRVFEREREDVPV